MYICVVAKRFDNAMVLGGDIVYKSQKAKLIFARLHSVVKFTLLCTRTKKQSSYLFESEIFSRAALLEKCEFHTKFTHHSCVLCVSVRDFKREI